jgi:hypothetical protein
MAIKGKGKTRRRTVAAGPKPVYVEPPKPLWRQRWAQLTALAVALIGIGVGVAVILIHQGSVHQEEAARAAREKERVIVSQFGSQVDQALQPVTQDFQDTKVPFPDLTQQLASVKPGKALSSDLVKLARDSGSLATDAVTAINKIPASTLVSGHPRLLPLIDSQQFLVQSLKVFDQASQALVAASKTTGSGRAALVDQAQKLMPVGADLFNNGYQRLVNVRTKLGLSAPPALPPQPSAAPSPTPTATTAGSGKGSGTKKAQKHSKKSGSGSG